MLLHESILHELFMHFQLGGVCFLYKRSVFPKYLRGVFFYCQASVSYGPYIPGNQRCLQGSDGTEVAEKNSTEKKLTNKKKCKYNFSND